MCEVAWNRAVFDFGFFEFRKFEVSMNPKFVGCAIVVGVDVKVGPLDASQTGVEREHTAESLENGRFPAAVRA